MEVNAYISRLNFPSQLLTEDVEDLDAIIKKYPYFQSARALRLKGLHMQRSFLYNKELKRTAAYTTDRDILFEFIVSGDFLTYRPIDLENIDVYDESVIEVKKYEPTLIDTIGKTVLDTLVYIENPEKETDLIHKIDAIVQKKVEAKQELSSQKLEEEQSAIEQSTIDEKIQIVEEKLEIGEPLQFQKNEKHSFNEWLQLTQAKPIERNIPQVPEIKEEIISEIKNEIITESVDIETGEIIEQPIINEETTVEITPKKESKLKKLEIIDRFIQANPKITPSKTAPAPVISLEPTEENQPYFMTETLAKIYLEQKKYQKAIQAYEILILKYPEKSSLFADRISYIKELQQYNNL